MTNDFADNVLVAVVCLVLLCAALHYLWQQITKPKVIIPPLYNVWAKDEAGWVIIHHDLPFEKAQQMMASLSLVYIDMEIIILHINDKP